MRSAGRLWILLPSLALMAFLYWGLSQAESRAIYAGWDKLLHAAVFFLVWWLLRWSLPWSWITISVLLVLAGAAEEGLQLFKPGHQADWLDWAADVAGVVLAAGIYVVGRLLLLLRESVQAREAQPAPVADPQAVATWGKHPLDWRLSLRLWRWQVYLVVLGGHERRELSPREQDVARWSVWFLLFVFAVSATAVGVVVVWLIKTALGW